MLFKRILVKHSSTSSLLNIRYFRLRSAVKLQNISQKTQIKYNFQIMLYQINRGKLIHKYCSVSDEQTNNPLKNKNNFFPRI